MTLSQLHEFNSSQPDAHGKVPGVHVIRIADSVVSFQAAEGDNLLRAGLRAGIPFPYECNAGGCGSCKFELVSGELKELWADAPSLSAKDRTRGRRLACQCVAQADCVIKVRLAQSAQPEILPAVFEAEYAGSRQVTQSIRAFTFRADGPARFLPGQYALLSLPETGLTRAYSMSNLPNPAGEWEFMVRRVTDGALSGKLFDELLPGQRIAIDGPLGLAHWRPDAALGTVCIAGGSGLAPMLSVASAGVAAATPREPVWLFYGGRSVNDLPDFSRCMPGGTSVRVEAAVSSDAAQDLDAWTGERGFIHEIVKKRLHANARAYRYYLAGPAPMIEATVKMLMLEMNVPASQIHYDRFF